MSTGMDNPPFWQEPDMCATCGATGDNLEWAKSDNDGQYFWYVYECQGCGTWGNMVYKMVFEQNEVVG